MFGKVYGLIAATFLASATLVAGLGSTCSSPLGPGTAGPNDPFWLANMKHQGTAAFNPNPGSYKVFRNVKDYGARGDGVTDDTAAINAAIADQSRCGGGNCPSTTISPAVVFFPQGTYLVSTPIIALYHTQLIGDGRRPPTIKSTANFQGMAVIDADPYLPGGASTYINQNNFFRSVRNFVIDLTAQPPSATATGFHWQVSQSTSLINIVVNMSTAPGNSHQGMFMENGSGGFMGDLVFNGGRYGIWVGNQQFTVRNITINNAQSAIFGLWNWAWTFQGVTINNCQVGFDLQTGGLTPATQSLGSEAIIDAVVTNTNVFIRSSTASNGKLAGALILNNIKLNNVPVAVQAAGQTVLNGGTTTITSWGQGNVYSGLNANAPSKFVQSNIPAPIKASSLLDGSGRIFGRTHPQYAGYAASQFVSVKSNGAVGDGRTDDTAALKAVFAKYAGCKIIFFDAGTYVVTSTLQIPAGSQIVGEGWSVIAGRGSAFQNQNRPGPVIQVGAPGSTGVVEITDMVFKTIGPAAGAIVVEWNVAQSSQGSAGMWDSHVILGGAAGTQQQLAGCPAGSNNPQTCTAAFMGFHLTTKSSAYLEGTWVWLADHDLDANNNQQITLFSGRGILSESQGPVWLVGTGSEHHTLYQYSFVNAKNHYMGVIQTETPYYQPIPAAPAPFSVNSAFHDPSFPSSQQYAYGLYVSNSQSILIFGAGIYNFFQNYSQACLTFNNCQNHITNIDAASTVQIYSLSTVGAVYSVSSGQTGIVLAANNADGFANTTTYWAKS